MEDEELQKMKSEVLKIIHEKAPYNREVWSSVYDYFIDKIKEAKEK